MKPKLIKTATFNKRKYNVYMGKLKGCTTVGELPVNELYVRTDHLQDRMLLNTLIHESIHACDWDAPEKKVQQMATDIARFLWRVGYRRQ
jgi:hypothetical protein